MARLVPQFSFTHTVTPGALLSMQFCSVDRFEICKIRCVRAAIATCACVGDLLTIAIDDERNADNRILGNLKQDFYE